MLKQRACKQKRLWLASVRERNCMNCGLEAILRDFLMTVQLADSSFTIICTLVGQRALVLAVWVCKIKSNKTRFYIWRRMLFQRGNSTEYTENISSMPYDLDCNLLPVGSNNDENYMVELVYALADSRFPFPPRSDTTDPRQDKTSWLVSIN